MELDKIFEGVSKELLTSDIQLKIKTLVEAAVTEQVAEHKKVLNEKFELYLKEKTDAIVEAASKHREEHLIPLVDKFLNHHAEEYVKENKLPIKSGLKSSLFESMQSSIREMMKKFNINEETVDQVSQLSDEKKKLEGEITTLTERVISAKNEAKAAKAKVIFESLIADLSDMQKAKIKELSKDYSVDDLDVLTKKINVLKESILSIPAAKPKAPVAPASTKPVAPVAKKIVESIPADADLEDEDILAARSHTTLRAPGSPSALFENQEDNDLL